MTKTTSSERRAPVQGDSLYGLSPGHPSVRSFEKDYGRLPKPSGTITWEEHLMAWEKYAERFGRDQSADRIAARSGFSFGELVMLLGREPESWKSR
jgi:hypothetical protein